MSDLCFWLVVGYTVIGLATFLVVGLICDHRQGKGQQDAIPLFVGFTWLGLLLLFLLWWLFGLICKRVDRWKSSEE